MKRQEIKFLHISTLIAFILIPLGGLTTDIYIPSLPTMARQLNVPMQAVQLSLLIFMVSSGVSQLFIGSILDSYGRYKINIAALVLFAASSFAIALIPQIYLIYAMRVVQGISVSLIIVGKRAFFVDMYEGQKLRNYTSMFSIVWATAPIVAPFIGGYLQSIFGWQANFYLLGGLAILVLGFELRYSGESLKTFQSFQLSKVVQNYRMMLTAPDFTLGLIIIGLSYSLLVIYGMVSPFLIEKRYGFSPVITGYSSLLSGLALMLGGIFSKLLINKPLFNKLFSAVTVQIISAAVMLFTTLHWENIETLVGFTVVIHFLSGFIFNNMYAYCLQRFTSNAGTASGLTGGGIYVISSFVGYSLIRFLEIKSADILAAINLAVVLILLILMVTLKKVSQTADTPAQLLTSDTK